MVRILTCLLFLSSVLTSQKAGAGYSPLGTNFQNKVLRGTIKDQATGEPLSAASVQVKGTTTTTVTDANGSFTISLPGNQSVLIISYAGFVTKEIRAGSETSLDITLNRGNSASLDEVVVVGYGTQRRGEITGAVASVKAENFVKGPVKDAAQLIQGKVAGLSIAVPSGNPVSNAQIMLRGITSITASSSPLILIDGIPGNLNTVAPEDIESIDVLKDGSAAAIYGTRGTNGVILITTRKGTLNTKATVEYSGNVSTQSVTKKLNMLTADDYRRLIGTGVAFTDHGANTDWIDEISQTPVSHVHNLSFRGGNNATSYIANLNYRYFEGIFLKSDNQTLNGRIDINHSMFNGILKANLSIISSYNKYNTTGDGSSFNGYTYRQAVTRNPTDMIRDANGDWQERSIFQYENPLARLMESGGENVGNNTRYSANLVLTPISGLRIQSLFAQTRYNQTRGYFETKKHISTTRDGRNGYASRGTNSVVSKLMELTADYNRRVGEHSFTILGGYSYQNDVGEDYWMQNWLFPTDVFTYNNIGSGDAVKQGLAPVSSYKDESTLIGFFGRLNYSYNDKYLLAASIRREGSTKFGENYRYGNFPAVSVGWRINRESFMDNVAFVNDLKLRGGFGVTGTAPGANYLALPQLGYSGYFFVNGQWVPQLVPTSNPNPDLRWEKKEELNLGLDFSLFNNRLSGSIDYYKRTTKDMLYDYPVPSPPFLYPSITANVGSMENKGLEVLLNYEVINTRNFSWSTSLNFSTNSNKLLSISNDLYKTTTDYFDAGGTGDPIQQATHRVQVGGPIGNFYGYKVVDVTDEGKWVYLDKDGKPTEVKNTENKHVLGNGLPKYYGGWNNNFRYKNFDLSITQRGAFSYQILNFQRMYLENPTVTQYNRLSTAFDKVFGKAVLQDQLEYTSHYIEDGDFWKIDNITLAYTFNMKSTKILRSARVFVSTLNTFTFTGYSGLDPEVNRIGMAPGNDDRDKYPTTRTYTLGVNLGF